MIRRYSIATMCAALLFGMALCNWRSSVAADASAMSATKSQARDCYQLTRQNGEPKLGAMPRVCRALTASLNASCEISQKPFRLALPKPVSGIRLAKWEQIPLSIENMPLLESLVRSRWQDVGVFTQNMRKSGLQNRQDYEWEIARRAIEYAKTAGLPAIFERTEFVLRPDRAATTYYRMSIDHSRGTRRALVDNNGIESQVRLYGVAPVVYTPDPGEPDTKERPYPYRSRTESIAGTGQDFVFYGQVPYLIAMNLEGNYMLSEISASNPDRTVAHQKCTVLPVKITLPK